MATKTRNVIISGLTAVGKTTHCKLLAREYGLVHMSASQVKLKLSGLSTEQPPDFWVTSTGLELTGGTHWADVDDEFRRIESTRDNMVFDCLSLPWLHIRECMTIWLESSLESRTMKAVVSYRGESNLTFAAVKEGIQSKDELARRQMLERYGVNLFEDRSPFDLVVDISAFITAPTEQASRVSIDNAHEIISSAVGWYLKSDAESRKRFELCLSKYGDKVIQRPVKT
jgi:cytidylate kinase